MGSCPELDVRRQFNMGVVFVFLFLALVVPSLSGSVSAPGNVLFCDICVDIVTDIDQFLVSDPTEEAVIEFVSQICDALGSIVPDFVATCRALIAAQVPIIIEGLVEDNLNPQQICDSLGACP